jgi:hypothetical protein
LRSISSFTQQLKKLDLAKLSRAQVQAVRQKAKKHPGAFRPETVEPISFSCAVLSQWVNAVCEHAEQQEQVREDVRDLLSLKKNAFIELRGFSRPPMLVAAVLGNVHCLLGLAEDWISVRANLRSTSNFLEQLRHFDQATMNAPMLQKIRKRLRDYPDSFKPSALTSVNTTCTILCNWVCAMLSRAGVPIPVDTPTRRRSKLGSELQQCIDSQARAAQATEASLDKLTTDSHLLEVPQNSEVPSETKIETAAASPDWVSEAEASRSHTSREDCGHDSEPELPTAPPIIEGGRTRRGRCRYTRSPSPIATILRRRSGSPVAILEGRCSRRERSRHARR